MFAHYSLKEDFCSLVLNEGQRMIKCANLLCLSTMTMIESKAPAFSRPSIKSMVQSSRISSGNGNGNGNGCRRLAGVVESKSYSSDKYHTALHTVRPPIIHTYQRRGRKVIGQINNEEGKRGGDRAGGAQAQK